MAFDLLWVSRLQQSFNVKRASQQTRYGAPRRTAWIGSCSVFNIMSGKEWLCHACQALGHCSGGLFIVLSKLCCRTSAIQEQAKKCIIVDDGKRKS